MHPSAITLGGVVLATAVCVWFLRTRKTLPFCAAILVVGCLDGLDGVVARVSGRATKLGAYLDAMSDRYVEALVALCAAAVTGYWALSMIVLVGSLLVSYAKARAAMEVRIANQEWPDLMERAELGIVLLLGLLAWRLLRWRPLGHDLLWWTLVLFAVLAHLTVLQRVLRARRLIRQRG